MGSKNQSVKFKVLYCLGYIFSNSDCWLTTREISDESGVDYRYLLTSLPRWTRFKHPYVARKLNAHGKYCYHIRAQGYRLIGILVNNPRTGKKHPHRATEADWLPCKSLVNEVVSYRNRRREHARELMRTQPFLRDYLSKNYYLTLHYR